MAVGIFFIIAGVLIAIFPELLSLIVATILVTIGISLIIVRYQLKRVEKEWQNPFVDFFTKW